MDGCLLSQLAEWLMSCHLPAPSPSLSDSCQHDTILCGDQQPSSMRPFCPKCSRQYGFLPFGDDCTVVPPCGRNIVLSSCEPNLTPRAAGHARCHKCARKMFFSTCSLNCKEIIRASSLAFVTFDSINFNNNNWCVLDILNGAVAYSRVGWRSQSPNAMHHSLLAPEPWKKRATYWKQNLLDLTFFFEVLILGPLFRLLSKPLLSTPTKLKKKKIKFWTRLPQRLGGLRS